MGLFSLFEKKEAKSIEPSKKARSYEIGVEDLKQFPHYAMDRGQYVGYARDVFDAFTQARNCDFIFSPMNINRLFSKFVTGQIDFKYPDNPCWHTDVKEGKTIHYSDPVAGYIDGVMVKPARLGRPLDDLRVLGIVSGFTAPTYQERIEKGLISMRENNDIADLWGWALSDRVDGIFMNIAVANYHLDNMLNQPGAMVFDRSLPYSEDSFFFATINHPDVIEEFNGWMKDNSNLIDKLTVKHRLNSGLD